MKERKKSIVQVTNNKSKIEKVVGSAFVRNFYKFKNMCTHIIIYKKLQTLTFSISGTVVFVKISDFTL